MNNLAQITKELTLDELHELRETVLALSEVSSSSRANLMPRFSKK